MISLKKLNLKLRELEWKKWKGEVFAQMKGVEGLNVPIAKYAKVGKGFMYMTFSGSEGGGCGKVKTEKQAKEVITKLYKKIAMRKLENGLDFFESVTLK